jgi:hypothetical protein
MSGAYLVFHVAMIAMAATGYFLGVSAPDVGALAPVVASAGAAMMVYSAIAEGLFAAVHLIKAARAKWVRV